MCHTSMCIPAIHVKRISHGAFLRRDENFHSPVLDDEALNRPLCRKFLHTSKMTVSGAVEFFGRALWVTLAKFDSGADKFEAVAVLRRSPQLLW